MNRSIEFYVDEKGEHRWRVVAENGKIVAASSEGFHDEAAARENLALTHSMTRPVPPPSADHDETQTPES